MAAEALAVLAASAVAKALAFVVYRVDVVSKVALANVSAARAVVIAAGSPPMNAVP
jgi:hypothetical protein